MKHHSIFFILAVSMLWHTCAEEDQSKFNALLARAQQGDSDAQVSLACHYRDGIGVEKDYSQAMHWAHLAADHGNARAMDFLGFAYLTGLGAKRNTAIAFGYFRASAADCARAAFNLGQCYFGAQGVEQDIPKAMEWWKKSAEMGESRAATEAAMVYLSGEGLPPDSKEALRLASQAAQLNDPSGLVVLGEIQFQAGQFDDARSNWKKASSVKPVGETGQPTQPSEYMSAQEASDLLKLMEYRCRKPELGHFAYVEGPFIHQGYNNCGATSTAMLARFQGAKLGAWDFKRLCRSPVGTGTDWSDLIAAAEKIGLHWKLVTFTADDAGFEQGVSFLRSELDMGRPSVLDFSFTGVQYPGGKAGHTVDLVGYIAADKLYILRNPAIPTPGLELITNEDLKRYWQSDCYSATAQGKLSRPVIVIDAGQSK